MKIRHKAIEVWRRQPDDNRKLVIGDPNRPGAADGNKED
jgi:hypothetical protein